MRSILVPLDGTPLSASIIPDAKRLAGPGGRLILIRDVTHPLFDISVSGESEHAAMRAAETYLDTVAKQPRAEGFRVEIEPMSIRDTAMAIDEAVRIFRADMVACATHGRGLLGRLVRGGIAWRAMVHSPVPVLLRHGDGEDLEPTGVTNRTIMVPLDGSEYSEKAIPVAQELAKEWLASVWLVQVTPPLPDTAFLYNPADILAEDRQRSQQYLDEVADTLTCRAQSTVLSGVVSDALTKFAAESGVTDIVMASHGRTGLARVIFGSVTDALLQHLHLPIVVVPALAAESKPIVERPEVEAKVPAGVR
jgi:nucleotide-binding universal stress UspA family protein